MSFGVYYEHAVIHDDCTLLARPRHEVSSRAALGIIIILIIITVIIYISIYLSIYLSLSIYIYIYICICVYIYIYIYNISGLWVGALDIFHTGVLQWGRGDIC